ncbi:GH92 family glycosyl hydrolase [Flavobacterium sediminilitoris]|uniref:GH92 family glycosyl hydrolase n=1 Tax=Flavobacterium sediminilitoris TaxID=2024526 RepID=A0ABY4HJN4_9FLAO|nr:MULTISPECIES: GH92 family glycosyl hydrolase [Flavobacterium]UOX32898.1 GH92 family glycosyl hydrolase [Flavobacterium sediminilitoris]
MYPNKIKYSYLLFFIGFSIFAQNKDFTQFVNPLVGTKNMGHTFPGATTPFGMVQLSPETNLQVMFTEDGKYNPDTYKYCAGYQYDDVTIFGFSHTHLSGTGHSDLGDFLIMPTTGVLNLNPGDAKQPKSGYHSQFSHNNEKASPGYYSVKLDDYNIKAELTATDRVGFHQYTFPKSDDAHIILDLISNIYLHDDKNTWTFIRVENDSLITGYKQTNGWARTKFVYFAMQFSRPFTSYGHKKYDKTKYNGFYRKFNEEHNFPEMAGKNLRAYFNFKTEENEKIKIKFALSSVSTNGALLNLNTELPHWDFEKVKNETKEKWNKELSKIDIETETLEQKETFYTAMYHSMLSPIIYEDVDGSYRGLDQNIHKSDGFVNHTVFSLWDTYRALHPLYNIIQPKKNNDMIKSMLAHHDQSVHNMLPIWSHYANENWCMVGYHAVSVIADAIAKGTTDVDLNKALLASSNTATVPYFDGLEYYMNLGYVPEDKSSSSVSKTLEYAYNDWCIALIAKKANNTEKYNEYLKRSENYLNVYDKEIGYMRPKLANGNWRKEFDPLDTHGQGFIEGNAWNYGLYVPHQIDKMIQMMDGKDAFSKHLDKIFTTPIEDKYIEHNEDITRDGIIGNYVHGNEPGHHIPYLYNFTNEPWKTQSRVRMILNTMYSNKEDGLCGNDDAGQMSAWYIFSSLGFYPVNPGSTEYSIGSPSIKSAIISLEDGNKFTIKTINNNDKNIYVNKIKLNGKLINTLSLRHQDIENGSELIFYMSSKPNKKFIKK